MGALDWPELEPDPATAYLAGGLAALAVSAMLAPVAIRKLHGARVTGRDRHKEGHPEVAEMGGVVVVTGLMAGAFLTLFLLRPPAQAEGQALAALLTVIGAAMTGILDDLISLRQRFKAVVPLAFAFPLALYAPDSTVALPGLGAVHLGWLYRLVLVPLAVTCAANAFNMLEGLNGLGTGLGLITGSALGYIAYTRGAFLGLAILVPLLGALVAFLFYNRFPARVLPGDTGTLLVGAGLAAAAVLSGVELWGALLLVPHAVEFFLKAASRFEAQSFASRVEGGRLHHDGPVRSLTHLAMRIGGPASEPGVVWRLWGLQFAWCAAVVALAVTFPGL